MKTQQPPHRLWIAFGGVLLLTVAAAGADRLQLLSTVRVAVQDLLSPGRLLVAAVSSPPATGTVRADEDRQPGALQSELDDVERQRRELLIENAELRNRLRRLQSSQGHSERHAPLVGFEVISAQLLSHHGMPAGLRTVMIDAGRAHGLTRSELVLDASGPLLDQGQQDGVQAGHSVLAGSVVLGRIERSGRWVSQLLPVTDQSFSARVQLIRRSARGTASTGVEGMLEGTGDACRIAGIADTASVAVGDEVFSTDINGVAGPRLYYGKVESADFESSGEWSIVVRPAGALSHLEQVSVLVPRLESDRLPAVSRSSERQGGS